MENTHKAKIGNELIPIESIISEVKSRLRITDISDYDAEIELYVNEGARQLSTNKVFPKKWCTLDIVNGRAALPCGFHSLIGLRFVPDPYLPPPLPNQDTPGATSAEVLYVPKTFPFDNRPTSDGIQVMTGVAEIIEGFIVFSFPLPVNSTKCEISYFGFLNDKDTGLMLIYADWNRAIRAYACWNMLRVYPELWPQTHFQFYAGTVREYKAEYADQKMWLTSVEAAEDFNKNKYTIKRIYQSLLYNQTRTNGRY